jgi:Family of unknown function (DUF6221)
MTPSSPASRARKARGKCSVCGTEQALRTDGMLHAHPSAVPGEMHCKGGASPPVAPSLAEFLAARLDETEAAAKLAAQITDWTDFCLGLKCDDLDGGASADIAVPHIALHDPARVLREVAAGRKLLEAWALAETRMDAGYADGLRLAVEIRASVYQDHPEFGKAWLA